ncbi:MAG: heavy metal translocating P-type ATPase [Anaerolineae bacterium]
MQDTVALGTKVLHIPLVLPMHADCPDCAARLRELLLAQEGVEVVHFDLARGDLVVHYDPRALTEEDVERAARLAGGEVVRRYRHAEFPLEGMDCADCALKLEQGVGRLEGVLWTAVHVPSGTLRVGYDPERVAPEDVARRVEALGYRVASGFAEANGEGSPFRRGLAWARRRAREAAIVGAAALALLGFSGEVASSLLGWGVLPPWWQSVFFGAAAVLAGMPLAVRGVRVLWLAQSLSIDLLMTVAVLGAVAIGEWAEGAVVVLLFHLGEFLEAYTAERARQAIRSLMALVPERARRLRPDGGEEEVPVGQVDVGDRVLVRPGERIPVDGVVVEGASSVDQSPVTGESMPVDRGPGAEVYAGSVNGEGVLVVRVARPARESTVSRMVRLVEEAQAQKARSQRFVDRFARWYTPAVVLLAALLAVGPTLAGWGSFSLWVYRALVLLVIACPCALVLATPVAVAAAIASAGRHGILVKGGVHLEDTARLRAIAFDKTGTLTYGRPEVSLVMPVPGETAEEVLRLAAAVESRSGHPLAQAVVAEAEARGVPVVPADEVRAVVGRGVAGAVDGHQVAVGSHPFFCQAVPHGDEVCRLAEEMEGKGHTAILVARDGQVVGLVGLRDALRPESAEAVGMLGDLGVRPRVMLTGDNEAVAQVVAGEVGLDAFHANLLPEEKLEAVARLVEAHGVVAMVGDGVNDAPALARATVGIAMGAASTDQALETADVALMGDDLRLVPHLVRLSRWMMGIVRENVAAALLVKALFLALALAGRTTLWMAVFADTGVALLVVLNAMRLLRWRPSGWL